MNKLCVDGLGSPPRVIISSVAHHLLPRHMKVGQVFPIYIRIKAIPWSFRCVDTQWTCDLYVKSGRLLYM